MKFLYSRAWAVAGILGVAPLLAGSGFSLKWMDLDADPRQDFARYAFGQWIEATPIPADKSRWGSFDEINQANQRRLRELLEDAAREPGAPGTARQLAGDAYASMIDAAGRERAGLLPIADLRQAIREANDVASLIRVAATLREAGVRTWLYDAVFGDRRDATRNTLYFFQGGLSLPDRTYYEEERFARERAALRDHAMAYFVLAGYASDEAAARADAVVALETAIAGFSRTAVERRDPVKNTHPRTAAELAEEAPGLPWEAIFADFGVAPETSIIVAQPEYFSGIARLWQERPVADWQAFLEFNLLDTYAVVLNEAMIAQSRAFHARVLHGVEAPLPAWEHALRQVEGCVDMAVGQLYVDRYFSEEVRARMGEMVDRVMRAFQRRLERVTWMEEATRQEALTKFGRFRAQVGFPTQWRDYTGLVIRADDAAGNFRRSRAHALARNLRKIGEPVDPEEWSLSPHVVNAYYSTTENKIVFLAGILQPPMFDASMDDAINYGAIGAVIGHEITHGFDDSGRKSDADGNLRDWWTDGDAERFRQRAQGLIDQFNAYEALPGLYIQGALALGENIADLGGLHVAWDALQELWAERGKPEPIDGLTAEQRFFLGWAQSWRTQYRERAMQVQVTRGPHAPGNFRAFAAPLNHPGFHEAFGTREGDAMWRAPEARVLIW